VYSLYRVYLEDRLHRADGAAHSSFNSSSICVCEGVAVRPCAAKRGVHGPVLMGLFRKSAPHGLSSSPPHNQRRLSQWCYDGASQFGSAAERARTADAMAFNTSAARLVSVRLGSQQPALSSAATVGVPVGGRVGTCLSRSLRYCNTCF
jgi:hypothetical protein